MSSPYELLAGLALLRERKRLAGYSNDKQLKSWSALLVRMGDTTCVLRQGDVDEIIARGKLSRINGLAGWVVGLGYFRGKLLNVLDGSGLLGLRGERRGVDTTARIMVVRGADEWFGLQVDELLGIRHVWSDTADAPGSIESATESSTQHSADSTGSAEAAWKTYVECWIKLEENTVPVLQIKRLVLELEQKGELLSG